MSDFKTLWATQTAPVKVYETIPTGIYTAQLMESSVALTSDQSNQTVTLKYKICTEGQYRGRLLFSNYTMSEKGIYFLKQAMLALGAEPAAVEAVENLDALQVLLNKLAGTMCDITAKSRTYTKKDGTEATAHTVFVNNNLSAPSQTSKPVTAAVPQFDNTEILPF